MPTLAPSTTSVASPAAAAAALGVPGPSPVELAPAPLPTPPLVRAALTRWSADSWLLLRRGSGGVAAAPAFASYGASQGGAVLRYALDPGSELAPQAYARMSRAVDVRETEVAVGLSLLPLAGVPLRLLGEARAQRASGPIRLRPAVSLVTEIAPRPLPLGAEGEFYAQAGYVAGALGGGGGGTPFFDAQLTAERPVVATGPGELRLGLGAWAGGQRGAARADLGPRASARLRLGPAAARVALDWRIRVAGNAEPGSGPTMTFSAGF